MPVKDILPPGSQPESDTFKVYSATPGVRFLSRAVQPPSQVYVEQSDAIAIVCATSATGEAITVNYRLLRADGQVILGQFIVRPPNTRAVTYYAEGLAEGFLLSVSCRAAVATTRGQTFARIYLTDPVLGAGQPSYVLLADYVTTQTSPAHPNGRVLSPVEGPGNPAHYQIVAPGPGNDWAIFVPANARWIVRGIYSILVTSVAVANRYVSVEFISGGGGAYVGNADKVQPAGRTCIYAGAALTPNLVPIATRGSFPLPPSMPLLPGGLIRSITDALAAADVWTPTDLLVEEWLDNV